MSEDLPVIPDTADELLANIDEAKEAKKIKDELPTIPDTADKLINNIDKAKRGEKLLAGRSEKTPEEVAAQVAKIARKLIDRADKAGLARDNYPVGKIFDHTEINPSGGAEVIAIGTDSQEMAKVEQYSLRNGRRVAGKIVTTFPRRGFDTRNIGTDGYENRVIGVGQEQIVADVPTKLSYLRGKLAEREISGDTPAARLAA